MPEPTKNLCAQIPVALHERIREEQTASGKTLSDYMTWLITTFYEQKEGRNMEREPVRTLAIQLDAALFDRLDAYLKRYKLKKKTFLTDLIRQVLEQAETGEAAVANVTPAADEVETDSEAADASTQHHPPETESEEIARTNTPSVPETAIPSDRSEEENLS